MTTRIDRRFVALKQEGRAALVTFMVARGIRVTANFQWILVFIEYFIVLGFAIGLGWAAGVSGCSNSGRCGSVRTRRKPTSHISITPATRVSSRFPRIHASPGSVHF